MRHGGNDHILQHTLLLLELEVVFPVDVGETPFAGDNDLLATREFVAGTAESLLHYGSVLILAADGEDDLSDVDTSDAAVRLAPSTTHAGLETIGASARQHLVDAEDVEGVDADAEMERILSGRLCHVLVGADTGGLERLGRDLLMLVRDEMAAVREVVDRRALAAKIYPGAIN